MVIFVDLRGIEPRPPPCHGGVIPFYYRPEAKSEMEALLTFRLSEGIYRGEAEDIDP